MQDARRSATRMRRILFHPQPAPQRTIHIHRIGQPQQPGLHQVLLRGEQLALRIQHLWDAAVHCLLVGMAAWQLLGYSRSDAQGHTQQHLTATAMRLPGGRWLVAGIGGGIVAFALAEWIMACRPEHDTQMDLSHTPWRRPILALLVLGHAARGALFGLIGAFLIRAAWHHDALDVTGIAGALQSMRQQPWGAWLLGSVAVGLIAFGLAQFAKARYRVIRKN